MLDLWSYKTSLKEQGAAVERELQSADSKLVIRAAIGAGRHMLVKWLSTRMDLVAIDFPSFEDLDAPLHGLVQLSTSAGTLDTLLDAGNGELLQHAALAAQALADAGRPVVVLMPVPRAGPPHEADAGTRRRIEQMLSVLLNTSSLRVAVLATYHTRLREGFTRELKLAAPKIGAQQIDATQLPGDFGAAASALAAWMATTGWASTPLEARLQVGLIALGERPQDVALRLDALARKMVQQLGRRSPLSAAVHRLLLARLPLPVEAVSEMSGVESRWGPLLTACIGYGDDHVRVPEVTRQVLLDALKAPPAALEAAHAALARYHESLDGAYRLRGLGHEPAINWLEKVHHLSLGGAECAARWDQQEPAGREQLWERARYLSRELHQFRDAARVYRRCIDRFGHDPYSSHYLAYNLERARDGLDEIRRGYAYAAAEEPENPWWQQRWIRFLIAHGTLAEARGAWQQAIRSIDPDGTRLRSSSWLALNLHCWVARRWLAVGRLEDAREVLAEVPERWLEEEFELRALVHDLVSQQQALVLGESVYPAGTPLADRWSRPRGLRPMRSGQRLIAWAPGRVVDAGLNAVTVVVAPTPDEAQQLTFDDETWRRLAGEPAEDADGFFELGRYEGGDEVVRPVPADGERASLALEESELLPRVSAWPS